MTVSPLDHLVYGVPDLLAGVRDVQELTGVEPVPGGRHPGRGTANHLIGLGDTAYLKSSAMTQLIRDRRGGSVSITCASLGC